MAILGLKIRVAGAWADLPLSEGGGGTPSDATPQPIGTAAAGDDTEYARGDHVHAITDGSLAYVKLNLSNGDIPQVKVASLTSDLAGKAASSHSHAQSDVTGLVSALAAKADSSAIPTAADDTPLAIGTAATGTSGQFAREDHVHALAVGGITDTHVASGAAIAQSKISGLATSLSGKSDTGHTHTTADVTSGTFAIARIPVATSGASNSTSVVRADDSRLSDSRTPTAHATNHTSGGSDAVTLSQSQITNLTGDLAPKATVKYWTGSAYTNVTTGVIYVGGSSDPTVNNGDIWIKTS